jgi:FlaA1/EpsC-like NDP-sugar epimerase
MTRFSITIDKAVELVYFAIKNGWGGEIILPICPSYRLLDVAKAIAPDAEYRILGARPGEKMHETMFTEMDAPFTAQREDYYVICPITGTAKWDREMYCKKTGATPVFTGMVYDSGKNDQWLSVTDIHNQLSSTLNS